MTEEQTKQTKSAAASPEETPKGKAPAFSWRRRLATHLVRHSRRAVILGVAVVAAAIVWFVTIDLGPVARGRVEQAASAQIDRPVHIGRLSTYLLPGRFLIEDLQIEGLSPDDTPFFTSDQIVISTSWLALLRGEILIDAVDMGNWRMVVESFPDGRHNFPRFFDSGADDAERSADMATPEPKAVATEATEAADEEATAEEDEGRLVTTLSYLLAHDGEFVYNDHGAPWSVVARNIELTITKMHDYGGAVSFNDATVQIGSFKPMTADMDAVYQLDEGFVNLTRIDLTMDGFTSALTGEVDLLNWPEQTYHVVESAIDLPTMKEIFFADDAFSVAGTAEFIGTWHIFDGGRELSGSFTSGDSVLNPIPGSLAGAGLPFPQLNGSLVWTRERFEVIEATSGFHGGTLDFAYSMKPLGAPTPGIASLDTSYREVDVAALLEAFAVDGARPEGRASGHNLLEWPLGRFSGRTGEGRMTVAPPEGMPLMTRRALANPAVQGRPYAAVPFAADEGPWHFPVGGEFTYTIGTEWLEIAPSRLATPYTEVEFEGRTAFGDRSRIPFRVSSHNWQESDRLMASVMTAVGAPAGEIAVGGHGQLDGVMLGAFASPRIETRFVGADIRAWNVVWGSGSGEITVENDYLDVVDGVFEAGPAELQVDGRFALEFPRRDGGEEINAQFRLVSFPAERMRAAFALVGYEINGPLTGEIHLFGDYGRPFGFGRLTLASPVAYGEPFDAATAGLRFEGNGVRVDGLDVRKGDGTVTGAAFIRWDGTYSFNVDGRDIEMTELRAISYAQVPLDGLVQFTASGVGAFDEPRYEVRGSIADLAISNEAVGQVTGLIDVRDGVMGLDVEAASPRLAISGSGRVDLTPEADAELLFRVTNTALDPYVRAFQPEHSSGITAVVSGTLRVVGELRNVERLLVDATVEQLGMDFFDYAIRNDGALRLALDQNVVRVEQLQLIGEGTALQLTGQIGLSDERVAIRADGDAGLGILQGFLPDLRSSGNARLMAEVGGTLRQPILTGEASVDSGRIRHFSLPHGLENVGGRIVFEPDGVRFDELTGELGGGPIRFGGRLGLRGYRIGELNITAVGTEMQLRFPEGVRSLVDAELTLGGDISDPLLSGTVDVRDAIWLDLFEPSTGLLNLTLDESALVPQPPAAAIPLRFDVRILAPSSLRISDNTTRIVSSAELTLGGTYDQMLLFGNAEIERGEVFFEGNRYRVTQGSISFANPTEVEPFFDIEAETDIRVPGQTYRVTLGVVGTMDTLDLEVSSDPPLPEFEIFSLLLGDIRDPQAAEIRALRAQEASRQELFQAGAARLLTSPLSAGVGRVVEESFGVDTFEITPSLGDPAAQQSAQLVPTARLLIGKRISERAHVTLSRTLTGANQDIIVVLEYDQNDRLSWILSQNEDRTYALDFRVRHVF